MGYPLPGKEGDRRGSTIFNGDQRTQEKQGARIKEREKKSIRSSGLHDKRRAMIRDPERPSSGRDLRDATSSFKKKETGAFLRRRWIT